MRPSSEHARNRECYSVSMTNKIIGTFLFVFLVVLIGTGIDFLVHNIRAEYAVPNYYFPDKIIFGTLLGAAIYWLVSRKIESRFFSALVFGALLSSILQIRYFIEGYPLSFVLVFLGVHFVAFSLPACFLLRRI